MDTIKKVFHSKEPTHQTDNVHHQSSSPSLPPDARPDQQTLDRLGSEPNVTGGNRPPPHDDFPPAHNTGAAADAAGDQPKINRGHHHPRQPVGATGPPAAHRGAGAAEAEAGAHGAKAQAEAGNNFPGTNP